MFQLLTSIAELERETIRERMTIGRDRLAREGKFINGPVPFGYQLSADDLLTPSTRWITEVGMSEPDLVGELDHRVAVGESNVKLALWLRAAGVPFVRRYFSRQRREERELIETDHWSPSRICRTICESNIQGYARKSSPHVASSSDR